MKTMKKKISYAAHFKPIVLPPLIAQPGINLRPVPIAHYLSCSHQQFIHQQTKSFYHFLNKYQEIQQQVYALIHLDSAGNEVTLPGPKFSRQDLEKLSSDKIAPLFGAWFEPLDQYEQLIRMPEPPLLLADRVTGIDAKAGSMGKGSLWTETDVVEDAWYLHQGRMPAGIMIESGQADLLLASWLGFDFYNQGQRVYRLLGCELSYFGALPKPGETLCYDIHIDGQAKQGDVRLFFFHYDCRVNGELRLKVRHGQAGFFTQEELARSGGVLWDSAEEACDDRLPLDSPKINVQTKTFSKEQLQRFAAGDVYGCFGQGFEWAATHTRTPCINQGKMLFLDRITHFDVKGGPWQRGMMRAEQDIHPDDWFFKGHFKNDPCMPGTLMLEAGLQLMACYFTALGYTLDKDGWRFEPIPEQTYQLRCRGQVIPSSKKVVYEIFISSVVSAPIPMLFADLLGTVDGLKAFHTKIGLRLVPDWPLDETQCQLSQRSNEGVVVDGFTFNEHSLLACALGKPSTAFGNLYKPFDNHRRVPRLPGPPYHFISRITRVVGDIGSFKAGAEIECEYDVPADAWYFQESAFPAMPFCVLLESALQPCGWLASFLGSTLTTEQDLVFRNLDGTSTLFAEVLPQSGTIRTHVKCLNIAESAGMIIESFHVESFVSENKIYSMDTVFGFFPQSAFENQVGLPFSNDEKSFLTEPSDFYIDLTTQSELFFGKPGLPDQKLLMIDRITGFWQDKKTGMTRLRAEKTVDPCEWFFKAHFFQDPVQPGSLGLEAMNQVLQFYMLQENLHHTISQPRFQPLATDISLSWKYRGQVVPTNKKIIITMDILETGVDQQGIFAIAKASLWVDEKRIYEAKNIGMRIVSEIKKPLSFTHVKEFDPEKNDWVKDHCPTYLVPTLPLMSMVNEMIEAAQPYFHHKKLIEVASVQALRWVVLDQPVSIQSIVTIQDNQRAQVALLLEEEGHWKPFAKGIVRFAQNYPVPLHQNLIPLQNGKKVKDPYFNLFHDKKLHAVKGLMMGENGSTTLVEIPTAMTDSFFNHIVLDALTHGIPRDRLHVWSEEVSETQVSYPSVITRFSCYGDIPATGMLRCETRFKGFYHHKQFPQFEISVFGNDKIIIILNLVDALFPKGPLGYANPEDRIAFLREKKYVPHMSLSHFQDNSTALTIDKVKESNWLPGSIAALYQISQDLPERMAKYIVIKEHFSHQFKVHPADVVIEQEFVHLKKDRKNKYPFKIKKENNTFYVMALV